MRAWWFNELGQPVHLGCGGVGRYVVNNGRHWLRCLACHGGSVRAPAPAPTYTHWTYGRAS